MRHPLLALLLVTSATVPAFAQSYPPDINRRIDVLERDRRQDRHAGLVAKLRELVGRNVLRAVRDLALAGARDADDLEDLEVPFAARHHGEVLDVEHRLEERVEVVLEPDLLERHRAEERDRVALPCRRELAQGEGEPLAGDLLRPLDELGQLHAIVLVHRERDRVWAFDHARLLLGLLFLGAEASPGKQRPEEQHSGGQCRGSRRHAGDGTAQDVAHATPQPTAWTGRCTRCHGREPHESGEHDGVRRVA